MAKKTVVRSMRILMRALVVTVGLYLTVNAAVFLTALVSPLTGWYPLVLEGGLPVLGGSRWTSVMKPTSKYRSKKWLRKSEQGDKWNRCLIEGMIVPSETGAREEQTTPP